MAKLIRVVRQILVGGVLYSGLNKTYKLTFITVFSIRVVIAYFSTLAPVSVVNEFRLL